MSNYRSIRTKQEVALNSSQRFIEPLQIPVMSFSEVEAGLMTPAWSPPYDIIINQMVITCYQTAYTTGSGPTGAVVFKSSYLENIFGGGVTIASGSVGAGQTRSVYDLTGVFTQDRTIATQEWVLGYCMQAGRHDSMSIQLYGERLVRL